MLKYSNSRSPESDTSETARKNRCHNPCDFRFPLPWLLSCEAGAGHRAKFRLQTAKQPVTGSLVAMHGRDITAPGMVACPVPCKSLNSGRAPTSSPSPSLPLLLLQKHANIIPAGSLKQPCSWLKNQELRACTPLLGL